MYSRSSTKIKKYAWHYWKHMKIQTIDLIVTNALTNKNKTPAKNLTVQSLSIKAKRYATFFPNWTIQYFPLILVLEAAVHSLYRPIHVNSNLNNPLPGFPHESTTEDTTATKLKNSKKIFSLCCRHLRRLVTSYWGEHKTKAEIRCYMA